jgi:SAM-dependent methyltransferase
MSKTTIGSYNAHVPEYVAKTPKEVSGNVKIWVDASLGYLAVDAEILEIGSASGRDADYIESRGYKVTRSDAAISFVELLRRQGHPDTRLLNAITDDLGGPYDMIFADAVLLHFTEAETATFLGKVRSSLKPTGIFSFRLKRGDGSEWTNEGLNAPRFFQYWQPDTLEELLRIKEFDVLSLEDKQSTFNPYSWLQVIARPTSEASS